MKLRKFLPALLVTAFGLTATGVLWAEDLEEARMRCEAEAIESGISDADQQEEYIQECLAASGEELTAQGQE